MICQTKHLFTTAICLHAIKVATQANSLLVNIEQLIVDLSRNL